MPILPIQGGVHQFRLHEIVLYVRRHYQHMSARRCFGHAGWGPCRISSYINEVESELIGVCDEFVEFGTLHVPHVPHNDAEMGLHLRCYSAMHHAHTQEVLRIHTSFCPKHCFYSLQCDFSQDANMDARSIFESVHDVVQLNVGCAKP